MEKNNILYLLNVVDGTDNQTSESIPGMWQFGKIQTLLKVTDRNTDSTDELKVKLDMSIDGTDWVNVANFHSVSGDSTDEVLEWVTLNAATEDATVMDVSNDCGEGDVRHGISGNYRS